MNFNVKEVIFKGNTDNSEKEETIKIIKHMSNVVVNQASFRFARVLYKLYIIFAGLAIINSNIFEDRNNDKFTTMLLIIGLCFIIEWFVDYVVMVTVDVLKGLVIIFVTISMFLIGTAIIAPVAEVKQVLLVLFVEYYIFVGIFYLAQKLRSNKKEKENISVINEAGVNNVELRIIENKDSNLSILMSLKNLTTNKWTYGKVIGIENVMSFVIQDTYCLIIDNKEGFKAVLKVNEEQLKGIDGFIYDISSRALRETQPVTLIKTLQQALCMPVKFKQADDKIIFQPVEKEELEELDKELNSGSDELKEIIEERETLEV